jgi:hypothetical protein
VVALATSGSDRPLSRANRTAETALRFEIGKPQRNVHPKRRNSPFFPYAPRLSHPWTPPGQAARERRHVRRHFTARLALPRPPAIAGVTPRVARAGYKDWGRCDLTYVELDEGTAVAGVFTRNVCCSSEVELGRQNVAQGRPARWSSMRAIPMPSPAIAGARRSRRSWIRSPPTAAARASRCSCPRPA